MAPRNRLRLLTQPSQTKSWGISMIEIMVALGLTSGLLMVDAERQRSNIVNAKQLQANEAVAEVLTNLQTWLRVEGTIKASFAGKIASITALSPATQENVSSGTSALEKVEVGGVERLKQAGIDSINFIGRPDGSSIQALDGRNGWAYIKAMWIDNFNKYSEMNVDETTTTTTAATTTTPATTTTTTPATATTAATTTTTTTTAATATTAATTTITTTTIIVAEKGTANLNVRTWIFTNRLKDSSLNCTVNNNCLKQTHILPLEIRVKKSNKEIIDGAYGVSCRIAETIELADRTSVLGEIPTGKPPNCEDNEFFNITLAIKHPTFLTVTGHKGQCCKLVQ